MASAAASGLDRVNGADSELTSSAEAARYIADSCLTDAPLGRVGLELEAHCFDLRELRRRPDWHDITQVVASLPELPGGSAVTVEPGGAVELSGPPADDVLVAIEAMRSDQAVLRTAFWRAGLGLVLLGTDPLRPARRINPGARYRAMERFFTASGADAPGAAMMTSTAAVQVNLDAGPRSGWTARVRLAHALGPTLIAVAANSPLLRGRFSGWCSTRQRIWGQLDSARCGPFLTTGGDDPGTAWARYALKAPVMLVQGASAGGAVPVTRRVPFAEWADRRIPLGGRYPTTADLDYHLTTLFPPVRPRGRLEIRYLDAVPDHLWPALVGVLVVLLDNPTAADLAAEAVQPVAGYWGTAARAGLSDRRLYQAANRCLAIAAHYAPTALHDPIARLVDAVEQGRCPADDLADEVIDRGIAPTITRLASR